MKKEGWTPEYINGAIDTYLKKFLPETSSFIKELISNIKRRFKANSN